MMELQRPTPNVQPRKSGFAAHAVNSLLRESIFLLRSRKSKLNIEYLRDFSLNRQPSTP
jgi:hypothetical protein